MVRSLGKFHDYIYQGYNYKLYVPTNYEGTKKAPLVVMLHGCEQDPDDFAAGTEMNILADRENFLVLYPNMNHLFNPSDPAGYNPLGCWNWFLDKNQHRGKGHPKLIFEIIEEVKRGYTIHPKKIYAAGLSAGGSLACILGVTYPDIFSAIGICSGLAYDAANVFFLTDPMAEDAKKSMEKGVPDPFACGISAYEEMGDYKKKMRVIVFHGISDTTVHPINGQQVITQWAQTNFLVEGGKGRVDVTPAQVNASIMNEKSYTQHIYNDASGEPLLELWMIDKMGHVWSGGSPNGSYTDPLGPNATEIIWRFFSNQPLPNTEKSKENHNTEVTPIPSVHSIVQLNKQIHDDQLDLAPVHVDASIHSEEHLTVDQQDQPPEHTSDDTPIHSEKHLVAKQPALLQEPVEIKASLQTEEYQYADSPDQSDESNAVETKVEQADQPSIEVHKEIINPSPANKSKKKLFHSLLSKITKRNR